jgi:hypothetical protein
MTMGLTCKEKRRNAKGFKRRNPLANRAHERLFGAGHHSSRPAAGQAAREKKALVLGKTGVLSCTFPSGPRLSAAPEKSFRFKEKTVGSNIGVLIGVLVVLLFVGAVVLMMVMEWSKPGALAQDSAEPIRAARAAVSHAPAAKKKAAPASKRKAPKKAAPAAAAKKKPAKKSKKK